MEGVSDFDDSSVRVLTFVVNSWSVACLFEWAEYLKLGIAGLLMLCLEWWTFETCQFLSGSV